MSYRESTASAVREAKGLCNVNDNMVTEPPHYKSDLGFEVIDVMEAYTADLKGIEAVDTSNVIRYICRWKNKNGIQDLKKALWYLQHLITHLEKENELNG